LTSTSGNIEKTIIEFFTSDTLSLSLSQHSLVSFMFYFPEGAAGSTTSTTSTTSASQLERGADVSMNDTTPQRERTESSCSSVTEAIEEEDSMDAVRDGEFV
jgi:hypothetical protein